MLHPGDWEPNLAEEAKKDLAELLEGWIGHDKPTIIFDVSGVRVSFFPTRMAQSGPWAGWMARRADLG
jgi:hypothetical protein